MIGKFPLAGYSLTLKAVNTTDPAHNTTYYFGGLYATPILTNPSVRRKYFPVSGRILSVTGVCNVGGILGSSQNVSFYIRINNTTDYLVSSSIQMTSAQTIVQNLSMDIPVIAGVDYMEMKMVTPTWTTKPTTISYDFDVFILI